MVMVGLTQLTLGEAHPYGLADSFPNEALQWRDTDGDGYGDVMLGAMRDDCPNEAGDSTRDLQGCLDSMVMAGQINMADLKPLLQSWEKTPLHLADLFDNRTWFYFRRNDCFDC